MQQTTLTLVHRLYEAFGNKDADALRAILSPAVRWTQCPGFPGGADRRGPEDVITGVMGGLNEAWNDFAVDIDEFIDAGASVVVVGAYRGVHAVTGKAMHSIFTHIYEGDGDRIVRFRQFADTWPMVEATQG